MTRYSFYAGLILVVWFSRAGLSQQVPAPTSRPRITLDEFFNFIRYSDIKLSPDGNSVVIATERPDWKLERFRHDLWLWTEARGGLVALTQSGHDSDPQWSPDGNWIAFISDRKVEQPPAFEEEAAPKEPPQQTPPPRRSTLAEAEHTLSVRGLRVGTITRQSSNETREVVLDQEHRAGEMVPVGAA